MNRRLIIGEIAGLSWVCADAAWALGDRWGIQNTGGVAVLFGLSIILGFWLVIEQIVTMDKDKQ